MYVVAMNVSRRCLLIVHVTGVILDALAFTNYSSTVSACTSGGCTESPATLVSTQELRTLIMLSLCLSVCLSVCFTVIMIMPSLHLSLIITVRNAFLFHFRVYCESKHCVAINTQRKPLINLALFLK